MNLLENTGKTKSRWLFSTIIGDYGTEYSETTHGAPRIFITVIPIMVLNAPNGIFLRQLVHSLLQCSLQ